jgi:hypothetical protein
MRSACLEKGREPMHRRSVSNPEFPFSKSAASHKRANAFPAKQNPGISRSRGLS